MISKTAGLALTKRRFSWKLAFHSAIKTAAVAYVHRVLLKGKFIALTFDSDMKSVDSMTLFNLFFRSRTIKNNFDEFVTSAFVKSECRLKS